MPVPPPASGQVSALQRVRRVTYLLDNSIPIPGTTYRVGLDPLLGLLPGAGDMAGAALSAYIILEAARFGLPRSTLTRMVLNLALDSLLGALPFVGDLFDATWKANSRNLALLEAHAAKPQTQRSADRGFLVLLAISLVLIVIGVAALAIWIASWLWQLLR